MTLPENALKHCQDIEPLFNELTTDTVIKKYIPYKFPALIELIVYQQISIKAGETIWKRLCKKIWPLTPEQVLKKSDEEIQQCGLSFRKVSYIKNVSRYYLENRVTFEVVEQLDDDGVVKLLTTIKGVGPWSANIFMMFTLRRENHSTYLDLALKNMVASNLGISNLDEKQFNEYLEKFSPYKTTASLCLWAQSKRRT